MHHPQPEALTVHSRLARRGDKPEILPSGAVRAGERLYAGGHRIGQWLSDGAEGFGVRPLVVSCVQMITSVIWAAILLVGVYCLGKYACDFTTPQALFLTVLAALPIEASYLRRSTAKRFEPFRLWIHPDYLKILMDAGLLSNESEWGDLLKANGVSGDDLSKGASCSVLSYNVDSDTHMIAWPDWKDYTSRLEHFLAQIDVDSLPLARAFTAGCRAGGSSLNARFGIKLGRFGLHLFMRIDDQWWKERWAGSIVAKPSFGEDVESWNGVVNLTVAVIPYAELQFLYHWKPVRRSVSPKQRRRALETLGWKTDYEPMDDIHGCGISHRYVQVSHEPVDRFL